MLIIGITGTLGAGKGTIVEYLKEKYDFAHYSVRSFLVREIEKRGLAVNRDSMVSVANDLRAKYHSGYIVEELYKEAVLENRNTKRNTVIESIRTKGEIEVLKGQEGFYLFAADANPKLRYERIKVRKSATDNISFEKFKHDEEREMQSDDPAKQNLKYCINQADFLFINEESLEELHTKVDEVMQKLLL